MRRLLLSAFVATIAGGCYPRYTRMEDARIPPATAEHKEVIAAPSYTAGPTQETTHVPDVAPNHYHN